jgi:hypothetical protein
MHNNNKDNPACKQTITIWHYAAWARLPTIVESGILKCSNAGAPNELPMLWFSANQQWEPTATKLMLSHTGKLIRLTFNEQVKEFGCIRFGIDESDPRIMNWKAACSAAGTPREMRRILEQVGKRQGANPDNWFASAINIPLSDLNFQVWGDRWMNATSIQDMADVWSKVHCKHPDKLNCL